MESLNSALCKLPFRGHNQYFILRSTWHEDSIDLELVDLREQTDNEWKGTVSHDYLEASAATLEIAYDLMFDEMKSGLCTNGGIASFEYLLENGKFTLRKVFPFPEIICQVELSQDPGLLRKLFLDSADRISGFKNELTATKLDYQKLDMEFALLAKSSQKSISEKNAEEKQILVKCAALLNAKKNKIAELQELLSEGRRLALQKNVKDVVDQEDNGGDMDDSDDEETQPMSLPETQPARMSLPKRKNLVAAETADKRQKSDEQEKLAPGESSDVSSDADSREIFDEMI